MKQVVQVFWKYYYRMGYTKKEMKRLIASIVMLMILTAVALARESNDPLGYSPWSFFGGLQYLYNADGDGVTNVPGMQPDGSPGGLDSAPSPLVGMIGAEYRLPFWKPGVYFAPSASLYMLAYLWANDRALPAEIENRTAFVPTLLLDASVLYTFEKDRFLFSFGGGPGFLIRYGFLESGVSAGEKSYEADIPAGEQVDKINSYLWSSLRWFYPMLQAGVRYRLTNGWGAGANLRTGIPLFNLWTDSGSIADSMMIMFCLTITPPSSRKISIPDEQPPLEQIPQTEETP